MVAGIPTPDKITRRAKVAPFQRSSIDVGHHGRVWATVPVANLINGDIVAGCGLVESVNVADGGGVEVEFLSRDRKLYSEGATVQAFVKKDTL